MNIEWTRPLLGGLLIGAGAGLLVLRTGETAGISGIFGNLLRGAWGRHGWRVLFIAGLLLPALAVGTDPVVHAGGLAVLLPAGLLVGIGTRLGSGCTSGHGVCGISQGSPRSIIATLMFMATAIVTVWIVRHGVPS